jgi:hypothetical protein
MDKFVNNVFTNNHNPFLCNYPEEMIIEIKKEKNEHRKRTNTEWLNKHTVVSAGVGGDVSFSIDEYIPIPVKNTIKSEVDYRIFKKLEKHQMCKIYGLRQTKMCDMCFHHTSDFWYTVQCDNIIYVWHELTKHKISEHGMKIDARFENITDNLQPVEFCKFVPTQKILELENNKVEYRRNHILTELNKLKKFDGKNYAFLENAGAMLACVSVAEYTDMKYYFVMPITNKDNYQITREHDAFIGICFTDEQVELIKNQDTFQMKMMSLGRDIVVLDKSDILHQISQNNINIVNFFTTELHLDIIYYSTINIRFVPNIFTEVITLNRFLLAQEHDEIREVPSQYYTSVDNRSFKIDRGMLGCNETPCTESHDDGFNTME